VGYLQLAYRPVLIAIPAFDRSFNTTVEIALSNRVVAMTLIREAKEGKKRGTPTSTLSGANRKFLFSLLSLRLSFSLLLHVVNCTSSLSIDYSLVGTFATFESLVQSSCSLQNFFSSRFSQFL